MIKKHNEKVKLNSEKKRNYERYVWTMTKTKGEGPITDMIIHANTNPLAITIKRGERVYEKNAPFNFSKYGIKEWDMMGPILRKKKNRFVPDLLAALKSKYKELEWWPKA